LKPLLREYDHLKSQFDSSQETLRKAKIELDKYYPHEKLTPEIREVIQAPNSYLDQKFEDLKKRYSDGKGSTT
jgi:hypothetical protein